jgi:hypothetical protein
VNQQAQLIIHTKERAANAPAGEADPRIHFEIAGVVAAGW